MGSFLRKGKRGSLKLGKKAVKEHTKEFYKILNELDRVYELVNTEEYKDLREQITEDNFVELLQPLTDKKIGKLEAFILKGKLGFYESMDSELQEINGKLGQDEV